jgi:hypothetical protein
MEAAGPQYAAQQRDGAPPRIARTCKPFGHEARNAISVPPLFVATRSRSTEIRRRTRGKEGRTKRRRRIGRRSETRRRRRRKRKRAVCYRK